MQSVDATSGHGRRDHNIPRALANASPAGPPPTMTTSLSSNSWLVDKPRRKLGLRQSAVAAVDRARDSIRARNETHRSAARRTRFASNPHCLLFTSVLSPLSPVALVAARNPSRVLHPGIGTTHMLPGLSLTTVSSPLPDLINGSGRGQLEYGNVSGSGHWRVPPIAG